MKGIKKIELIGVYANWFYKVLHMMGFEPKWLVAEFRFTLGALEDFKAYAEEKGVDADKALTDMGHLGKFLSIMTSYTGNEISADKFKYIDFNQVEDVVSVIEEASGGLGKAKVGAKK
jgi:hypothetical protein